MQIQKVIVNNLSIEFSFMFSLKPLRRFHTQHKWFLIMFSSLHTRRHSKIQKLLSKTDSTRSLDAPIGHFESISISHTTLL